MRGLRAGAISLRGLPVLNACSRGPLPFFPWAPRVRMWGPVSDPTLHPLESSHCTMLGWHDGIRCLHTGCPGRGSLPPPKPVLGACSRGPLALLLTARGLRVGKPPQRMLLRAGVARYGGGWGAPVGGRAPCAYVMGDQVLAQFLPKPPVLPACSRGPLPFLPGRRGRGRL